MNWRNLLTPPEWDTWSLIPKVVYWVVFSGLMWCAQSMAHAIFDPLFYGGAS